MDSGDALTVDPYFPIPNAVEPVPIKWRSTGNKIPVDFLFDKRFPTVLYYLHLLVRV